MREKTLSSLMRAFGLELIDLEFIKFSEKNDPDTKGHTSSVNLSI